MLDVFNEEEPGGSHGPVAQKSRFLQAVKKLHNDRIGQDDVCWTDTDCTAQVTSQQPQTKLVKQMRRYKLVRSKKD